MSGIVASSVSRYDIVLISNLLRGLRIRETPQFTSSDTHKFCDISSEFPDFKNKQCIKHLINNTSKLKLKIDGFEFDIVIRVRLILMSVVLFNLSVNISVLVAFSVTHRLLEASRSDSSKSIKLVTCVQLFPWENY